MITRKYYMIQSQFFVIKTTKGKCGKDCHQFCSFSCYISRGTFAWSLWYMYMTTLIAYFFKQLIVNNREMKRFSCTYWWGICVKLMCAYAKFWHIYFYFHLHATLGAFYVCFLVNMYLSGTCICMSLRALHLHTCTCSHSLNYIFMGWISCCVLMHLFNILITLIFFLIIFKEFVDIELFLVSRKVEESLLRREIGPCLAWCYENKSKLRKFKVDVLYFSLKKL